MIRDVVIHDARGKRICTSSDFPLRIGESAEADIRLPGRSGDATFVYVGISETHLFVQPADDDTEVCHNDQLLTDSRWLEHGDVLTMAGISVRYEAGVTSITFVVEVELEAPQVQPPKEPPPETTGAAVEPVMPQPHQPAPRRRGRSRFWSVAALTTFVLLSGVAAFVFLAVPVSVHVAPAPEKLAVEGMFPIIEVGERYLLLPGEYRVRASKSGYRELDAGIDVAGSEHQELKFRLEKLPGIVTIESRPIVSANVSIDGSPYGKTPLGDLELAPGLHEILVQADRYQDASLALEVQGLGHRQGVSVELMPRWAVVSMTSKPSGARVLLDGEPIGETPLDAEILEGNYGLELQREGHDTVSTTLAVIANQPQTLPEFALVESDGVLALESVPRGAAVSVSGQYRGRTPLELNLAPRVDHKLRIAKAGYETLHRRVSMSPAAQERLSVTLSPQYGSVFIITQPADAVLYVDGKSYGPATGRVKLTTVAHDLEFRKKGYESFRTSVTPRAGVSQEISVQLKTLAAAKAAARKPQIKTGEGQVLKLVKPDRFRMGASRREQGRRANETVRLVGLTRAYYLSVKEVTNGEYRRFLSRHSSGAVRGKSLDGDSQPVVQVTWENAVRYLNWLSVKDSLPPAYEKEGETFVPVRPVTIGYRLPTEAEWAFAARYASKSSPSKYPWGNMFPPTGSAGNYADSSASTLLPNALNDYSDSFPVSAPVGSFAPSAVGFHDLGGNVAEWCHDYYAVYPNAADKLENDPMGPSKGRHHVVRGSSWRHASISELRLSYRDYSDKARSDLGFRIARYAD